MVAKDVELNGMRSLVAIKELNYKNKNKMENKITLAGTKEIDQNALYYIDWSKLERVEELITILACIGFSFNPAHPHWNLLEKFVDLDNPINPNVAPVKHDVKLPKLKTLNKDGE